MVRDRIFVSYRREDSRAWAARLIDDLRDDFGRERVYRDIDSNRAGQDYVLQIQQALVASQVVIAAIGPQWSSIADDRGAPRVRQADDPVRLELEIAFAEDVPIVPVLVDGAAMPQKRDLPASIERLARIHACRMSDDDWEYDLSRLLEGLEDHGVFGSRTTTAHETRASAPVKPAAKSRYERTLLGSRRRVFDAAASTVEALGYRVLQDDASAATITFKPRSPGARETTVKVLDAGRGHSLVVVELVKVRTGGLAAASAFAGYMTLGIGLLAYPAVREWEASYAKGLLDNVQSLLEGRGLGKDSALLPGVDEWRNRSKQV